MVNIAIQVDCGFIYPTNDSGHAISTPFGFSNIEYYNTFNQIVAFPIRNYKNYIEM